jgi:hypothetical protein
MKKILTLILATIISGNIFAQLKAGIKFSPTLAMNTVTDNSSLLDGTFYSNNSLGLRYSTGLNLDFHINHSVAFGTGLWFTVKRAGFKTSFNDKGVDLGTIDEIYNLQYLQIPLTLKMFTNEIADDMKLYFQLGPSIDIRINEKIISDNPSLKRFYPTAHSAIEGVDKSVFSYLDFSVIGGAGVEWQMGEHTAIFGGLSYNRGLLNTFNPTLKWLKSTSYVNADINNKTSAISLDLGIKF